MIIAATNATDLTTGDAQATGSPIWTRKRKLYLAIFVGLAALQQGYRLAILRNLHVSPISPYLPFRRPANYTTIFDYNISSSAGMSLTQITWESSPGIFQEVDVCHFKNLCVKNYSGQSLAGKQRYWLAPTEDGKSEAIAENELTKAETAFRRCLNSPFTPVPDFSLKPLLYDPQRVAWLKGHSYASVKADFGAHPITWLNVWSRLVSLAANVPDLLSSFGISHRNFFDHIVLLEQECRLNEWAIALKDAFVAAAREALLGSFSVDRRPALGISDETEARANLAQQPDYHDHREFSLRNTGNKIATCFESITVPAMSKMDYFRDSFDASLSKKWAFFRAKVTPRDRGPCEKDKVKAVFLLRNDRPLWNVSGLVEIMRLEGLENISFKTITPATPFHDQVKIWNDADIVVSVHGSQLTNAFFMAPHSAFVEIFMPFYHNDDLAKLAKMAQIKHVKLLSDKLVDKATVKAEQPAKLAAWHHMQRVMHKYPNFRSCHRHSACRDGARQIGALADPLAFREAISHILDGMLGRGDCVPGP